MDNLIYSFALPTEIERVKRLLSECKLPFEDIGEHLHHFILAIQNAELVGVVGLEVLGTAGLIRSLAVKSSYRERGIAKGLYLRILAHAHLQGIIKLYLLTTTAEKYFAKLGFVRVKREEFPESVKATQEFVKLCPESAVGMIKNISREARYFPGEVLRLQPDVPGANMWSVALNKTMLTYFEIEPNSCFKEHSHESEQITMVLEGTLYFQVDNKLISVNQGEVIAIPSNTLHTVYTKNELVKAVDAWSPVMGKYKKNVATQIE